MNYMELLKLEIQLNNYLNDILEYAESACEYLQNPNSTLDKDEIIMYLSSVPECIKEVDEIVQRIEEKYEKEIEGDSNE